MEFFNSAVDVLQTLVVALGAALAIWGVINLLEGYGNDNPGAKSQGRRHPEKTSRMDLRKSRTSWNKASVIFSAATNTRTTCAPCRGSIIIP